MVEKYAQVYFKSSPEKTYTFLTNGFSNLKRGDKVIVTSNSNPSGEGNAIFANYLPEHMVQKNIKARILRLKESESSLSARKEQILEKMRARRIELEELSLFKRIAYQDPEMNKLVLEYENL